MRELSQNMDFVSFIIIFVRKNIVWYSITKNLFSWYQITHTIDLLGITFHINSIQVMFT